MHYSGDHGAAGILAWIIGLVIVSAVANELRGAARRAQQGHARRLDPDNGIRAGRWRVRIAGPDRYPVNGLNHVVKYIARLLQSRLDHASLIIASQDGRRACLIIANCGSLTLIDQVLLVPTARKVPRPLEMSYVPVGAPEPEKEAAIRRLFAEFGIEPDMDEVRDHNGHTNHMRHLQFPLGNEVSRATMIVKRYLREVYGVQDGDGLGFTVRG